MKQRLMTSDQTSIREMNLSTVLFCLQERTALSRTRLAQLTGLNKTTISSLVEELLEQRLVHEIGLDTSSGGRPAVLLGLNPRAGCVIGVELGVDFVSVILTDFVGQVIWREQVETNPAHPQDVIISQAFDLVDKARAVNEAQNDRLLGVGLTIPGMVDIEKGVLLFSPNLQWRDVALRQLFMNHTGLPVVVDNDANAAALGEYFFGAARRVQNFIFLSIGVGIGGGLFLDGQLYRGSSGIAGEIGHANMMADRSRPCRCGNRGCWETSGNQYALVERVRALLEAGRSSIISNLDDKEKKPLTLSIIAQAAAANDDVVQEALAETGRAIGVGIANLVNILNPEMVIIGGAMGVVGRHLLPAINKTIKAHTLQETWLKTELMLSEFGSAANMIGAVALVVNAILTRPYRLNQPLVEPVYP